MSAVVDLELKKKVEGIYTPLSVAKEEIWRRWNDKALRKKVEDFLGGDVPDFFGDEPKAVLSRDIISPNKECVYFFELSRVIGLNQLFIEYLDGKFVAKNFNKYQLCKMFFYNGRGKKGGEKIETKKIVNFNKYEGKKIKNIKTVSGMGFVDFHHSILKGEYPKVDLDSIFDFSEWFNRHRKESEFYYLHYLSLFLVYGVLFDNFIVSKGEKEFTNNKIIPSFKEAERIFGLKPIVVPLTPIEDEDCSYWWYYPNSVKEKTSLLCQ